MNRKIAFRAWDVWGKKIIDWEEIYYNKPFNYDFHMGVTGNLIPLQYTGLQDKNGKEIYEGDILLHHGIVAWNNLEHCWSVIDLNWNDKREWHNIDYLSLPFEIIGNIYENPELLDNK